jgi:electron transport complex protein RnfB
VSSTATLAEAVLDALPQTQCTRCGYPDCRGYAQAIAEQAAPINQCPPGGAQGIVRLAQLTGQPVVALSAEHGTEGPRTLAVIDEDWCIGCTLCIQACPVDCIVGAAKQMHTVIDADCTGCELCVPACPVDCIALVPVTGERTGWDAWSPQQAEAARRSHALRGQRLAREQHEHHSRMAERAQRKLAHLEAESAITDPLVLQRKRSLVEAAIARARERKA